MQLLLLIGIRLVLFLCLVLTLLIRKIYILLKWEGDVVNFGYQNVWIKTSSCVTRAGQNSVVVTNPSNFLKAPAFVIFFFSFGLQSVKIPLKIWGDCHFHCMENNVSNIAISKC